MNLYFSTRRLPFYALSALLVSAVLLGGASRLEVLWWAVPTVIGLLGTVLVLWTAKPGTLRMGPGALWLMAAIAIVPLIQLVPLPYSIWSRLPGRAFEIAAFQATGLHGWLPISVIPSRTLVSALSLVAPFCAFFLLAQIDRRERMTLAVLFLGLACASALLGILQVGGGPDSPLRFYAVTATDAGVGVFANPNHQATFVMCALPLVLVLVKDRLPKRGEISSGLIFAALLATALLVAGMLVSWSRAGLVFLAMALAGIFVMVPRILPARVQKRRRNRWLQLVAAIIVAAVAVVVMLRLSPAGTENFVLEQGGGRIDNIPIFARIASNYFPFGTGLGTFDPIYRTYETLETMRPHYLNQAHNEPAQLMIEAGAFGAALLVLVLAWWGRAFAGAVRSLGNDVLLRFAAGVGSSMFLVHSLVDYPLRTTAGMVAFAILCGLMLPAREDQPGTRSR